MGTPVSVQVHVVATNRKARHNFEILDTIEAGLVLTGTEVKSLRNGGCSLTDGYAVIRDGQATLRNVHIAAYKQGTIHNVDPLRDRRLLLHRNEILRLAGKINERGLTVVPLRVYFKNGRALPRAERPTTNAASCAKTTRNGEPMKPPNDTGEGSPPSIPCPTDCPA